VKRRIVYFVSLLMSFISCDFCLSKPNKTDILQCSRCKNAFYCSEKCQRADWPQHKLKCKTFSSTLFNINNYLGDASDGRKNIKYEKIDQSFNIFHEKDVEFWKNAESTDDSMLGGLSKLVDEKDVVDSSYFLEELKEKGLFTNFDYALDCGAGIGRVTKKVLSKYFAKIDMVEQEQKHLEETKKYLKGMEHKIGNLYCSSLQNFIPEKEKYDLIWLQWVVIYLSDSELISLLQKCQIGLKKGGFIVIKDNVTRTGRFWLDVDDGSIIRSLEHMNEIISNSKLVKLVMKAMNGLPPELFPVNTFVLK
jgi:hypothetical protein